MPDDSGAGEKTEEATPKKREDARKEGQVAFSTDFNTTGLLLIGFCALAAFATPLWETLQASMRFSLTDGLLHGELRDWQDLLGLVPVVIGPVTITLALAGILFLAALLLSALQVGLQPTLKPLMPKWSRISPWSGLKRIFGMRGLMRFVLNLAKLTLVIGVAATVLRSSIVGELRHGLDVGARMAETGWLVFYVAMLLALVLVAVAIGDLLYQRWQHSRDLLMSKYEVKQEFKQSEGDPLVKSRIRQIQRQIAQQRMMQEVPKADVVITNPTHVAVALRYDQEHMDAPLCVAKGYDLIAQRIKQIAADNEVPTIENVALARGLAKVVQVGGVIPVEFYQQVAEILAQVYRLKRAAG